ncbi:hypothetical protein Syun_023590 [Stephania yunnanensis]|uniref:Secreted protein n=1 Tax=Stephania yunnanensis TaxID=152371 RepID=A0AAP0I3U9_9MAGN
MPFTASLSLLLVSFFVLRWSAVLAALICLLGTRHHAGAPPNPSLWSHSPSTVSTHYRAKPLPLSLSLVSHRSSSLVSLFLVGVLCAAAGRLPSQARHLLVRRCCWPFVAFASTAPRSSLARGLPSRWSRRSRPRAASLEPSRFHLASTSTAHPSRNTSCITLGRCHRSSPPF